MSNNTLISCTINGAFCGYTPGGDKLYCQERVCKNIFEFDTMAYYAIMKSAAVPYAMIALLNIFIIRQHVRLTSIAYHDMRIAHLKGVAKLIQAAFSTTKYLDFMGSIMMLIASSLRCFMYAYDVYGLEGKLTSDPIIQTILFRLPQWLDMGMTFQRISIWHKVLGGLDSSWIQRSKIVTPLLPALACMILVLCDFASLVNISVAIILLLLILLGIFVSCKLYWRLRSAETFEKEHGAVGIKGENEDSILLRRNRKEVLLGVVPIVLIGSVIVGTVLIDASILVKTMTGYRVFLILTIGGEILLYFFFSYRFFWVSKDTFATARVSVVKLTAGRQSRRGTVISPVSHSFVHTEPASELHRITGTGPAWPAVAAMSLPNTPGHIKKSSILPSTMLASSPED